MNKDAKGIEKWDGEACALAARLGWTPTMYIWPPGMKAYVTQAQTERTAYIYTGAKGVSRLMEGPKGLGSVRGTTVYETPVFDAFDKNDHVSLLNRVCVTGEYNTMVDLNPEDVSEYKSDERSIWMYDEDKDCDVKITLTEALAHSGRFSHGGLGLDPLHAEMARNSNNSTSKAMDMFLYRDKDGKVSVCSVLGQMHDYNLSQTNIGNVAKSVVRGLTAEDVRIIDEVFRSLHNSTGARVYNANDNVEQPTGATPNVTFSNILAKAGNKFASAFDRLHTMLRTRLGADNIVLSPYHMPYPDDATSDTLKGQATLFYSLLNFAIGITGMNLGAAAAAPATRLQVPKYAVYDFDILLNMANTFTFKDDEVSKSKMNEWAKWAESVPDVDKAKAKYLIVYLLKEVTDATKLSQLITGTSLTNLGVGGAKSVNDVKTAVNASLTQEQQTELGQALRYIDGSGVAGATGTGQGIQAGTKVVPLVNGCMALNSAGKFETVIEGNLGQFQYRALPPTFDFHMMYKKTSPIGQNIHRASTGVIIGSTELYASADAEHYSSNLTDSTGLLGASAHNGHEMIMFGACPPLLFNVDHAHNENSASMRAALLATLFLRLNETNLDNMLRTNTYFPFGFVIARPWQMHEMATIVLMEGGPGTGVTYWGHSKFAMNQDASMGIVRGYLYYYSRAIVFNERKIILGENVKYVAYLGGGGSKFMSPDEIRQMRDWNFVSQNKQPRRSSLLAFMVPGTEVEFDKCLDLRGALPGVENADKLYSTAEYYTAKYEFDALHSPDLGYLHFSRQARPNSLIIRGYQRSYSRGSKQWDIVQVNQGHHGPRVGPGCARVRDGQQQELPANFGYLNQSISRLQT